MRAKKPLDKYMKNDIIRRMNRIEKPVPKSFFPV